MHADEVYKAMMKGERMQISRVGTIDPITFIIKKCKALDHSIKASHFWLCGYYSLILSMSVRFTPATFNIAFKDR